jgi:hypothetical protein
MTPPPPGTESTSSTGNRRRLTISASSPTLPAYTPYPTDTSYIRSLAPSSSASATRMSSSPTLSPSSSSTSIANIRTSKPRHRLSNPSLSQKPKSLSAFSSTERLPSSTSTSRRRGQSQSESFNPTFNTSYYTNGYHSSDGDDASETEREGGDDGAIYTSWSGRTLHNRSSSVPTSQLLDTSGSGSGDSGSSTPTQTSLPHVIPSASASMPDVSPSSGHPSGSTAYSSGVATTVQTTATATIRTRFFSGWDPKGKSRATRDHRTICTVPGEGAGETETEADEPVCLLSSLLPLAEVDSLAFPAPNVPSAPSARSDNSPTHPSTKAHTLAFRVLPPFISRASDNWYIVQLTQDRA